jgi:hypothetical protein
MNCGPTKSVIKRQLQKGNFFEVQETGWKQVKGEKIMRDSLEEKRETPCGEKKIWEQQEKWL